MLILLSVGGITLVSFLSFQRIEWLLVSIIETKVSPIIQNAELEREFSKVSAETNLLISNFTAQDEKVVRQQGTALLEIVRKNLTRSIVTNSEELRAVLEQFIDALQSLVEQGTKIIRISAMIQDIDAQLSEKLGQLEDMVSEKMLMLAMQGTNSEAFSLEQLVSMIPEYKNFHSQLNIQLIKSNQANAGLQIVENTYEDTIVALLNDFKAALGVITISGKEFEAIEGELRQLILTYQQEVVDLHAAMRTFQDRLTRFKQVQDQAAQDMAQINLAVSHATENIRQEATSSVQSSKTLIISLSIAIILILIMAGYYALRMIRPLTSLARTANQLAQGDISSTPYPVKTQDEIGILAVSFRNMVTYVQNIANVTEQIAEGNLQVNVQPRSPKDVLNTSLQKLVIYIQEVAQIMHKISQKDLNVTVTPKSEQDVLNTSLQHMVQNLQSMMDEIGQQNWIKDGLNQLNMELSGGLSLREVCDRATSFIARYLQAGQGVLYIYHAQEERLQLQGTFAFAERDEVSDEYRLGEGLIGQVALERKAILLKHPSRAESVISTGTFDGAPLQTYTFPLVHENELFGVAELASFEPFDDLKQEFLQEVTRIIAMAIFSAIQRERVQTLLRNSQE
ncbi:two-component hybrid sensor and regulator [Candidatus Vecturithrix granuli]|uniref:Two-component hybrid sensor and regulator n=1 Tax=Vecturithrix granuli TaxID=1499967 RepID=A0A081C039_VECG1|nr:two-component hybrid sensor and regulator [Candidatus Vecturithrix granuli]